MGNFTRSLTHELEFDGDNIKITIKPLKRKDLLKLTPHVPTDQTNQEQLFKFVEAAAPILPDYIESIEGIKDANGEDVPLEHIIEDVYFIQVASQILGWLFDTCAVGKEQEKNLEKSPGRKSKDS